MTEVLGVSALHAAGSHRGSIQKTEEPKRAFSQFLSEALEKVNQSQLEADRLTQLLAAGEITDLHQVMIAAEKANIQLQLTLAVRNKVVEAYQEIMRMQM